MSRNLRTEALQAAADLCFKKRVLLGLSVREFAKVTGVKPSSLRNLEANCSPDVREASGHGHSRRPYDGTYQQMIEAHIWAEDERAVLSKAFRYTEMLLQGEMIGA